MTKDSKTNLTDAQLDRVVDALAESELDVDDLLAEADADDDGDTVSDDDAISYALDTLHGRDLERVETRLKLWPEAREEMAWLRQEAEAWKGPAGEERVRAMARSIVWRAMPVTIALGRLRQAAILGLGRLAESLGATLPLAPAIAWQKSVAHGEAADGLVRWEIVRGDQDSLAVRLSSWATSLAGTTVRLRAGTWVADCVLRPIGPGEVGANAAVPAEERRMALAAPSTVTVEIVEGPSSAPREA